MSDKRRRKIELGWKLADEKEKGEEDAGGVGDTLSYFSSLTRFQRPL